jgi:hypothetical protein
VHHRFVGDVAGERKGPDAEVSQFLQGSFRRDEIVRGHPIALFGEGKGDTTPDATSGAGYEGDTILYGQSNLL